MRTRNNIKSGFTLVEVILFLALSSAILIAILAGTSSSLAKQRYNDAVQDLYSFLRSQYSGVIDVANTSAGGGQSPDRAIYGKLLIFDERTLPSGDEISTVESYTVTGNIVSKGKINVPGTSGIDVTGYNTNRMFDALGLQIVCNEKKSYDLQEGATIENTEIHGTAASDNVKDTVAILRSPLNGTIYTYHTGDVIVHDCPAGNTVDFLSGIPHPQFGEFGDDGTKFEQISNDADHALNLCVYSEDRAYGDRRRNIRIFNTNSISSIRLIPLDDFTGDNNKCKE